MNYPSAPYGAGNPTVIRSVIVDAADSKLKEPYIIATGKFENADNVMVRVELENGVYGLGEGSPSGTSGGETQATILAAAREIGEMIRGRDAASWRTICELMTTQYKSQSSARCAVESAVLDAYLRHCKIPMYRFFGGASTGVETDISIPIVTPDRARELAAKYEHEFSLIKIKVGGNLADDEARVVAVHEAARNARIMIDGNQGYNAPNALRLLDILERRGIIPVLFEQPVHRDDWKGMAQMTAQSHVPIAADESVQTAADAIRVAQEHAAHYINIKLVKSALSGALDIVGVCHGAKIGLMIGAMMESRLGAAVSAHFAAGIGGFSFIDLDTPMLIADEKYRGGYSQTTSRYELAGVGAGHGVERW